MNINEININDLNAAECSTKEQEVGFDDDGDSRRMVNEPRQKRRHVMEVRQP